ncbi:reductive dehalogenase, partial [Thermodesulfobacteriota bacterium]
FQRLSIDNPHFCVNKEAGWGLKERALAGASKSIFFEYGGPPRVSCGRANVGVRSWNKFSPFLDTPEDMGVPKYNGTPEEAAKIVKQSARYFGAFRTGVTGLDRRHVFKYDSDGKEIVFEDVEEPYETEEKRVIPKKCRFVVVMLLYMGEDGLACAPAPIGAMVPLWTYKRIDLLTGAVAEFIRGLGYTAIPCSNDTAVNGPFANEAGLGEQGRADKLINPEVGALVRICKVFTDLPMELDRPQKFGIEEFCEVCKICVEACPVNTINEDKEPSFDVPGEWSNPGHKTWHGDNPRCWAYAESTDGGCGICLYVCPWNKPKGLLHSFVKGIIKRTTLFNRFFLAGHKFFGYGKPMTAEQWWNLDLPTYGFDSRR